MRSEFELGLMVIVTVAAGLLTWLICRATASQYNVRAWLAQPFGLFAALVMSFRCLGLYADRFGWNLYDKLFVTSIFLSLGAILTAIVAHGIAYVQEWVISVETEVPEGGIK